MLKIQEHVPLAPLTTFSIGGEARWFADAHNEDELRSAYKFIKERHIPHIILGGGSNFLFSDEGFDGLVVHMADNHFACEGNKIICTAGVPLLHVIKEAAVYGLCGMEKLAGIPGSIGGAITEVHAFNNQTGEVSIFDRADCAFGYRHSVFKSEPHWVITKVVLHGEVQDRKVTEQNIQATIAAREKKHRQNIKSAGSFFVNPVVKDELKNLFEQETGVRSRERRVPAGWLLERAGVQGLKIGGAQSSPHHANYFLNNGTARSQDVLSLANYAKKQVKTSCGAILEEEVTVVPFQSLSK
jgi:UDP-N-acetylmuramate dehydrogenase